MKRLLVLSLFLIVPMMNLHAMVSSVFTTEGDPCPYFKKYQIESVLVNNGNGYQRQNVWVTLDDTPIPANTNCVSIVCDRNYAFVKGYQICPPSKTENHLGDTILYYYEMKSCGFYSNPISGVSQEFEYCESKKTTTRSHE